VPLTINCWPSVSGGDSYVNIEYEAHAGFDLQNVVISIPCHTAPRVNEARRPSRGPAALPPGSPTGPAAARVGPGASALPFSGTQRGWWHWSPARPPPPPCAGPGCGARSAFQGAHCCHEPVEDDL